MQGEGVDDNKTQAYIDGLLNDPPPPLKTKILGFLQQTRTVSISFIA